MMSSYERVSDYSNKTNSYIIFYPMHKTDITPAMNAGKPTNNPDYVQFLGFVNEFNESFASSWDAQQYYGKTDPIVGFKNTKRAITLAWKIPTTTLDLARQAYSSLNSLASYLYPYYMVHPHLKAYEYEAQNLTKNSTTDVMQNLKIHKQPSLSPLGKPPLFGVSWGQLIRGRDRNMTYRESADPHKKMMGQMLICHIENFTMSPQIDVGYFSAGTKLYPKVWNCSVALTVQHTHELGRQAAIW